MFCVNCGKEIADSSKFCPECGKPVKPRKQSAPDEQEVKPGGRMVTENICLGPDGCYRWVYELNMLKNPTILITVWKVLGIAFGAVYLFDILISLATDSMYGLEGFWGITRMFLILAAVFLGISIAAYLIVAAVYGGKYVILFEMDEKQVKHIQMPRQYKKAQVLGLLGVLAGLVSGNPAVTGGGLAAAARSSTTSVFVNVAKVKARRQRHVIYVNQLLNRNQVYAEDPDYEFVRSYIAQRCVNAKIR